LTPTEILASSTNISKLKEFVATGKNISYIAKHFNTENRSIKVVDNKLGLQVKPAYSRQPRDLSKVVSKEDFVSYFNGKETMYDAEAHFNIDHNTARSLARKYGCLSKIRKVSRKEQEETRKKNSIAKYGVEYPSRDKSKKIDIRKKAFKTMKANGSQIRPWASTLLVEKKRLTTYLQSSSIKKTLNEISDETGYSVSAIGKAIRKEVKEKYNIS
jgi:ATP-dependent exoDNAse (exonuclease V) alpha subunit